MTNSQQTKLSRREVIRQALLVTGMGALATSPALVSGCAVTELRPAAAASSGFSALEIEWLDEVAETILPETETPGAKAAEVGAFIAIMVADTYSPEEQKAFRAGMLKLESHCRETVGTGFMEASAESRLALLEQLDRERIEQTDHYFAAIKELTVLGYFTSEIGYTQALRYVETPGRYDPCVQHASGSVQWARHA